MDDHFFGCFISSNGLIKARDSREVVRSVPSVRRGLQCQRLTPAPAMQRVYFYQPPLLLATTMLIGCFVRRKATFIFVIYKY